MTFKKINEERTVAHDRSCIILVNFPVKEISSIKAVCNFTGIRDIIQVSDKNYNNKIRDILDNNTREDEAQSSLGKAILFNNIENNKITGFLGGLKKLKIRRPLSAVVTETSVEWDLATVLDNLKQEQVAMSKGQFISHDKK